MHGLENVLKGFYSFIRFKSNDSLKNTMNSIHGLKTNAIAYIGSKKVDF